MFNMNLWRYAIKGTSQGVLFIAKTTTIITLQHESRSGTMVKLEFRKYTSIGVYECELKV